MPRYAISFDLDRKALTTDGYTDSQINNDIYGKEVKTALKKCGFTQHPEGSVYHTEKLNEEDSLAPIVMLQQELQRNAPTFCKYVKSIHLFKMEGWSDILTLIQNQQLPGLIIPRKAEDAGDIAA
ncbi:hypothetical protein [Nostoc sp.]|uniref:hypothetical protein n=1 Tax=Nostoc sp. TaxID=1180 RepID=UPI002FFBA33D